MADVLGDCRVCGQQSQGMNFGAVSCKACASFFRRSIACNRMYVCRTGKRNCVILKNKNFKCRLCRLQQCLDVGMKPENVQRRLEDFPDEASDSTCPSLPLNNDRCPPIKTETTVIVDPIASRLDESRTEHLDKLADSFSKFYAVMRCNERAVRISNGLSPNLDELLPAAFTLANAILKCNTFALPDFLTSSFAAFKTLSQDKRILVIKQFIPRFVYLAHMLDTAKLYTVGHDRFFVTLSLYLDMKDGSHFFDNHQDLKMEKSEMAAMMVTNIRKGFPLISVIHRMQLCEVERVALASLLLWTPHITSTDDEIRRVARQERTLLFTSLQAFYDERQHLYKDECRFGELMTLLPALETTLFEVRECMILFKLFDFFVSDAFVYEVFDC